MLSQSEEPGSEIMYGVVKCDPDPFCHSVELDL